MEGRTVIITGASDGIGAAAAARLSRSGEYYADHKIARANPRAYDPVLARELWERSLAMVAI